MVYEVKQRADDPDADLWIECPHCPGTMFKNFSNILTRYIYRCGKCNTELAGIVKVYPDNKPVDYTGRTFIRPLPLP